jgi:hypothetical protein
VRLPDYLGDAQMEGSPQSRGPIWLPYATLIIGTEQGARSDTRVGLLDSKFFLLPVFALYLLGEIIYVTNKGLHCLLYVIYGSARLGDRGGQNDPLEGIST